MLYPRRLQLDAEGLSKTLAEATVPAAEPQAGAVARQSAGVDLAPWNSAALRAQALAARLPALPAPADVDAAGQVAKAALELETAAVQETRTLREDLLANDSLGG